MEGRDGRRKPHAISLLVVAARSRGVCVNTTAPAAAAPTSLPTTAPTAAPTAVEKRTQRLGMEGRDGITAAKFKIKPP
jgi:hypothetical protein